MLRPGGAKEQAEPLVEAALDRARVKAEHAARTAIPLPEKAIGRAKAYLDRGRR